MKKIVLSPNDELNFIQQTATVNAFAFEEFKEKKDFDEVERLFRGTKGLLEDMDKQMTRLCLEFEDQDALTNWASRVQTINKHCDNIERSLPFKGQRLFDWDSVLASLGLLLAFRTGVEQTISMNQPRPKIKKATKKK